MTLSEMIKRSSSDLHIKERCYNILKDIIYTIHLKYPKGDFKEDIVQNFTYEGYLDLNYYPEIKDLIKDSINKGISHTLGSNCIVDVEEGTINVKLVLLKSDFE